MNSYHTELTETALRVVDKLNEEYYEKMMETGQGFDFTVVASSHYTSITILNYTLWDGEENNNGDEQTEEVIEKYVREQLADLATTMQVFLRDT